MEEEIKTFDLHELDRILEVHPCGKICFWFKENMIYYKYNFEEGVWKKEV